MRSRHKRGEDAECDSRGKPGGPSFWGPARRRTGASSQARTGAPSAEAEQPSPDARSADSEALEEAPRAGSARALDKAGGHPSLVPRTRGLGGARRESPPPAPLRLRHSPRGYPAAAPSDTQQTPPNTQHRRAAVKKAEHRRIDAFELWCWRRLLRVPWTATSSETGMSRHF